MGYENITLRKPNVTMIDGYFYTFDEDQDALVVKTDDGTQAFTYPLSTTITSTVKSLEHDGRNFWTLQNGSTSNSLLIRRWYIDNYVCKLREEFPLASGINKFVSDAFTVEHYHVHFAGGGEPAGETSISVNTGGWNLSSKLTNGMVVSLGPSTSTLSGSAGKSEEFSVQTVGSNYFTILGTTSYYYNEADTISFYKNVWLFNDYDGTDGTSGALYELNPRTGCSVVGKRRGGEFQSILACTFYDVSNVDPSWGNAIAYIKSTNMIFIAPVSAGYTLTSYGSMVMDNIEIDLATVIPIHDVTIEGNNVYRLQMKATYGTTTTQFTNYQYQLSTLQKFITSISLKASPAILPADGTQLSTITAVVKDQFNLPITGVPVSFTREPPTEGEILQPNPDYSDDLGVASTYYQAGVNAAEIVITATASQADV